MGFRALPTIILLLFAQHQAAFAAQAEKVALYVDDGVWGPGVSHLKEFMKLHGFSYEVLNAEKIIHGELRADSFSSLIMPGGKSWEYLRKLGPVGGKAILNFVEAGGGYFGICAGGFYASSMREGPFPTGGRHEAETAIYPYGIGLFDSVAVDGANVSQLRKEFRNGVRPFDVLDESGATAGRIQALLLEGSGWRIEERVSLAQRVRVLARFTQSHLPAILTFEKGRGRAFITGPHLEIEEQNFYWGLPYRDPESDWPLVEAGLNFVKRGSSSTSAALMRSIADQVRHGLKARVPPSGRFSIPLGLF